MSPIASAYRSAELTTLSQREMIVKLYEGAEGHLLRAVAALSGGDRELGHFSCIKAKDIICELLATLDLARGGEIASRLRGLYLFFMRRISEGNLRKDPNVLREILPMLADLRSAWQQIPDDLAEVEGRAGLRLLA